MQGSMRKRLQTTATKKLLLDLKIERITQTGIDQMPSPPPSPGATDAMVDIDVARAKEENRRFKFEKLKAADSVRMMLIATLLMARRWTRTAWITNRRKRRASCWGSRSPVL